MKTFFVILFIMGLALVGCEGERLEKVAERGGQGDGVAMKTILAVGDSLTAGFGVAEEDAYPALLEKKLRADGYPYRVINAGVSAETSSGTLSRLEWLLTMAPDIVILETGANDGLRGIDPQVPEDNIRAILKILRERDVVAVLAGMRMVRNLGEEYVERFNGLYPRLAAESGVVFIPFFLEGVAMRGELNQTDGIHPNPAGYAVITENIYPYVLQAIAKREGR